MGTAEGVRPAVAVGTSWRRGSARRAFGAAVEQFVCTAHLPHAGPGDTITHTRERTAVPGTAPDALREESASPAQYPATDTYWHPLPGPLPPGAYRCRVRLNGTIVGEAPFAVVREASHPAGDGEGSVEDGP